MKIKNFIQKKMYIRNVSKRIYAVTYASNNNKPKNE